MNSNPETLREVANRHTFITKSLCGKASNGKNEDRLCKNFSDTGALDYQNMSISHDSDMNNKNMLQLLFQFPLYSYFHIACNLVGALGSQ